MMNLSILLPMAVETVKNPRGVAGRLMGMKLGPDVLWQALALVVVLSVLLGELAAFALGGLSQQGTPAMFFSPLRMGLIQFALLALMVSSIYWIGRAVGGTGRFSDGLIVVVWLQFVMICLQVAQTVAMLTIPLLAWLIGIFGLVLFLWLLTHFIAVVHGFTSLFRTFIMIVATSFCFAFALSLILTMAGVTVPGMGQP